MELSLDSFSPLSPEFQADPYPFYRQLRSMGPVVDLEVMGVRLHLLTRYADVFSALRDPRLSAAAVPRELLPRELADGNIFYKDPPDHTRLRNLLAKAFTPHVAESLRPHVQQVVDDLFDAVGDRRQIDVVKELAVPLSLRMISEMLGLPLRDIDRLKAWSDDLSVLLDGTRLLYGIGNAQRAAAEFITYLRDAIEDRRRDPRGDLLSSLVAARHESDRLNEDEVIATSLFTFVAGHETLTCLAGNGTLALLQNPRERDRLAQNPELVAGAIDELLRYDAVAQLTIRLAKEDLEIGGRRIEQGRPVCALMGAGNRDPDQFPDPDRLDIGRADARHLGFGQGAHYCMGAPLARIEAQVLFGTLARRAPGMTLVDGSVVRRPGVVLRGLDSLQIAF